MRYPDQFDWHGCEAVRFNPDRLSGRATVGETRMDADGIFLNFEDGLSVEELHEHFGSDKTAIQQIIDFARAKGYRADA